MSALATHIPRTLIADDQPDVLAALRLLLKGAGFQTEAANSPKAVLAAIKETQFDVVLIDLNYARDTTSGQEGLDLISRIQAQDESLPIVVMTAWATVDLAVEAMRRGVRDFVQKPWENSRLLQVLRAQVEQGQTRRRARQRASQRRTTRLALRRELAEARLIQEGLMPATDVDLDSVVLSSTWRVAGTVGGDYLAAFPVGNARAALCIADVSGKGLPAAMLMSNMQAALKSAASENVTPLELCSQLNKLLNVNLPLNRFITCFYGLLDLRRRILQFTNAGHTPALLVRGNGRVVRLSTGGRVLGAFPDSTYQQGEVDLYSGDRLALFTDGVTEARNASGEEFGESRLRQLLSKEHQRNAADLQQVVMDRVSDFCGGHFEDDAALMVLEVK
ncbi:MAG TPA: SpoIIE family protein phosphatase [Pyrinomonadaceae bacterium]|nr:SpoIIE family protein phosphatase [Pyrinomonadaceae bacterium]